MSGAIDTKKQITKVTYNGAEVPLPNAETAFEEGRKAEHDRFWDAFQSDNVDMSMRFAGRGWNDDTFSPTRDIRVAYGAARQVFYNTMINDLEGILKRQNVAIDVSKATIIDQFFCWSVVMTSIPEIVIGDGCTSASSMFSTCRNLHTIRKLTFPDKTFTVTNMFLDCSSLENIEIGGTIATNGLSFSKSTKLSKASIESVIHALSTETSGLSVTLSKTAVETAFGSTTATEWTNLINTKSNWTINLI